MFKKKIQPLLNIIRKRPILAVFEVNLQCNSQCGYCNLPLNLGRYEMDRNEIKQVFTNLYKEGLRFVFIQGGEPTLRKDLHEILQDLHAIGFNLTIITNGTRLTASLIKQLKSIPVSISISLDTLDREHYREIRGADQLNFVLAGIERLIDYPHPKYLTCIVSEKNKEDVIDILHYARSKGFIPVIGAYHWDVARYGKVDPKLQYQRETAVNIFKEILISDLVPRGYFRNYIKDNINWLSGNGLNRCDAGSYSIAIDPSGNVAPCLALKHAGNLLESSLNDILSAFDRNAIQQCSDNSSCNMMCSRVVGSSIRNPVAAMVTPKFMSALKR